MQPHGVTGSKHLVEAGGSRILLDCDMLQGLKLHRERNWQPLPIDLHSIDAVVLSHAHRDHSGGLPVLVKHDHRGPNFTNTATRDQRAAVVHGDPDATDTLRFRIGNDLGWRASEPPHAQQIEV